MSQMTRFNNFQVSSCIFSSILVSNVQLCWCGQELGLAAQIVHVVIAGNSVEFPRKLLTGQVLMITFPPDYTASVICLCYMIFIG